MRPPLTFAEKQVRRGRTAASLTSGASEANERTESHEASASCPSPQCCDVVPPGTNFCSRCPYVSAAYTPPRESTTTPCTQSNSPGPRPCLPQVARILPSFNEILCTRSP